MNSGDRRQAGNQMAEEEYMKHVRHLILTCLRRLMSLPETEVYLAVSFEVQPEITRRAWRRLEEQLRDFFFWYNMRCGFHISLSRTMHQHRLDMMQLNRPANQDHLQPALNTPSSCMSPVPPPFDLFAIQRGNAARIAEQNMGYVNRFASVFHHKVKRNNQQHPQRQGRRPNHQQQHHRIQQQQRQPWQHGPGPNHQEMAVSEVIHDEAPSPSKYESGSDSSSEMTSAPRKPIRLQ